MNLSKDWAKTKDLTNKPEQSDHNNKPDQAPEKNTCDQGPDLGPDQGPDQRQYKRSETKTRPIGFSPSARPRTIL